MGWSRLEIGFDQSTLSVRSKGLDHYVTSGASNEIQGFFAPLRMTTFISRVEQKAPKNGTLRANWRWRAQRKACLRDAKVRAGWLFWGLVCGPRGRGCARSFRPVSYHLWAGKHRHAGRDRRR